MTNETIIYEKPDEAALLSETSLTLTCAEGIVISSSSMYALASDELKAIKTRYKELEEKRVAITRPMDLAKKLVMDLFRQPLANLAEAETFLKNGMLTYANEQERLRKVEQARLDAIAKAERDRLEAEAREVEREVQRKAAAEKAEVDRISNEARIKREAEAKAAADLVANAANEEAKQAAIKAQKEAAIQAENNRIKEEQDALDRADEQRILEEKAKQQAQILQNTALVTTATVTSIAPPKSAGISIKGTWKAKCHNKAALVAFVAAHPEYLGLLDVSDSALNAIAKAQKENMNIGGCEPYFQQSIASRSK